LWTHIAEPEEAPNFAAVQLANILRQLTVIRVLTGAASRGCCETICKENSHALDSAPRLENTLIIAGLER